MKHLRIFSVISLFIVLVSGNCKKNNSDPIEELPPETQTGANTFGCLIDGKIFLPKGNPLAGPIKKASYQLVNGKYSLLISGSNTSSNITKGVGMQGDSIIISTGTFELVEYNVKGKLSGSYAEFESGNINDYFTNNINRGQLTITKFDTVNQIISGRFWFDAKNSNGQIVQVREGRFDMPYVR
jgi:hypothetical protein